jgi:plastocyanin
VKYLGLLSLVLACAPAHDPALTARLERIEARLDQLENRPGRAEPAKASAQQSAEPTQPTEPAAPNPPAAPAPPGAEPSAPAAPSRANLSGAVKLQGPYAAAGGATVVALSPLQGARRPKRPGHFQMEQSKKSFAPHVLAVPIGSTVAFPNHDVFFHNVFSLSPTKKFDLGVFDSNKSRDVVFDSAGVVQILCNLHAAMSGYIVVLEEPYFTIADSSGRFTLHDLPPGRYRARAWSERSKSGTTVEVELRAGANHLAVTVPADAPPQTPPDKHGRARSAGY